MSETVMTHQEKIDDFLRTVAEAHSSLLLLDYDGTLAPFYLERDQAAPYPGVTELLQRIADSKRTRLVIITGREAGEAGALLRVHPTPEVWGLHGLQRLRTDGTCEMAEIPAAAAQALTDAEHWPASQYLDHQVEIKPGSIAVHWRGLGETAAGELREKLLRGWIPIADRHGFKLLDFDGGIEMRIAGPDKGDAVRTVLGETGPAVPVAYLGDDTTDERAFRALENRGFTALVRPTLRKTSAQVWLKAPEELMRFLSRWDRATNAAFSKRAFMEPVHK